MICGDCDNNFVFINALQCTIYAYICILFFSFLGYKLKNQQIKQQTTIKPKKNFWFWKKNMDFCTPAEY